MINAFSELVLFYIQADKNWKRIVEEPVSSLDYELAARSVVVLETT